MPKVIFFTSLPPDLAERLTANGPSEFEVAVHSSKLSDPEKISLIQDADFLILFGGRVSEPVLRSAQKSQPGQKKNDQTGPEPLLLPRFLTQKLTIKSVVVQKISVVCQLCRVVFDDLGAAGKAVTLKVLSLSQQKGAAEG